MKKLIYTLALCLTALVCQAKVASPPLWVRGEMPTQSNSSYYFKVTSGQSYNRNDAKERAIQQLMTDLMITQKSTVRDSKSKTETRITDSTNGYSEETRYNMSYMVERGDFDTHFRIADEYHSGTTYWILFEVAQNPSKVRFDEIKFSSQYGGRGLWRSMLVPGWGQMYKKSTGKGVAILCGEVAFAGGIIATENLRKSYINKRSQTQNVNLIKSYTSKANNAQNIRNACIGGAAALYIYNIVDAIVAPGARRPVSVTPYVAEMPGFNYNINGACISFKF